MQILPFLKSFFTLALPFAASMLLISVVSLNNSFQFSSALYAASEPKVLPAEHSFLTPPEAFFPAICFQCEFLGSPVKPCVWIWINPINLLNQLNHPKGVCFYINKFLRND